MPTKEKLLEDFKKFDFDEDGIVSPDELLEILKHGDQSSVWDLATAQMMLKEIAKRADKDNDGRVSVDELAEAFADE